MSPIKKLLIGVGIFLLVVGAALGYLWWNDLTPMDFFKSPVDVLDETVYAAQQEDVELFKKGFTERTIEEMEKVHKFNSNIDADEFNPAIHWTWETLMQRFEVYGGFDVIKEPGFYDRWFEDKAEVKIEFDNGERTYPFIKEHGVWRLDLLSSDRDFQFARTCVREPSTPMCSAD